MDIDVRTEEMRKTDSRISHHRSVRRTRCTERLLFRWLQPHHALILFEVSIFSALITSYAITVGTGKLPPVWLYISETGSIPPASCIFTILFSLSSVAGSIVVCTRHKYMERTNNYRTVDDRFHSVNDIAMFIGQLSCLGILVVGCIQTTVVF